MRVQTVVVLLCLTALAGCGGGGHDRRPSPAATRASSAQGDARPAKGAVVLGEYGFVTGGVGWGDARPEQLNVGGDPALVIHKIRWRGWGTPHARGLGRASAFTGHGGSSYLHQVRVELRAYDLGRCEASGPRAYMNLRLRMPSRPGAPMGQWFVLGGGKNGLCRQG
jgi:hypothetical protein